MVQSRPLAFTTCSIRAESRAAWAKEPPPEHEVGRARGEVQRLRHNDEPLDPVRPHRLERHSSIRHLLLSPAVQTGQPRRM